MRRDASLAAAGRAGRRRGARGDAGPRRDRPRCAHTRGGGACPRGRRSGAAVVPRAAGRGAAPSRAVAAERRVGRGAERARVAVGRASEVRPGRRAARASRRAGRGHVPARAARVPVSAGECAPVATSPRGRRAPRLHGTRTRPGGGPGGGPRTPTPADAPPRSLDDGQCRELRSARAAAPGAGPLTHASPPLMRAGMPQQLMRGGMRHVRTTSPAGGRQHLFFYFFLPT